MERRDRLQALRSTCAACGGSLGGRYYTFTDQPQRYCERCMAQRPRCDACGAPVGEPHWRLHDGRVLCAACHATAVLQPEHAERIFQETLAALQAQLGLTLRLPLHFRMVDAPTLARLRAVAGAGEARTLGLFTADGDQRAVYMLYGLPLITFRTVLAHEIAHAWQVERAPYLSDDRLREGFAEWVAYRHLLYLGCTKAAQRMLTAMHPYRPYLEELLQIEQQRGPAGVLAHIR